MNGFEFVDELPPRSYAKGQRERHPIVDVLQSQPGTWARIKLLASPSVGGSGDRLRKRGCEVAMRTVDGKHWLYARWPASQFSAGVSVDAPHATSVDGDASHTSTAPAEPRFPPDPPPPPNSRFKGKR